MSNVLQHDRLTRFGRGHQQPALSLAYGGDDINDAASDIFLSAYVALQCHLLRRKQRC